MNKINHLYDSYEPIAINVNVDIEQNLNNYCRIYISRKIVKILNEPNNLWGMERIINNYSYFLIIVTYVKR